MNYFDCAIVGAGVIGLMTARELQAEGMRTVVIDRRQAGRESSWAGGGILFPVEPGDLPEAGMSLVEWSRSRYQYLCESLRHETGIDAEWLPSGALIFGSGQNREIAAWTSRFGLETNTLSGADAAGLAAPVNPECGEAVWLPSVAQVRNPRLMAALKRAYLQAGGMLLEHVEIERVHIQSSQVGGLVSDSHTIDAQRVVIAAGAWSSRLLGEAASSLKIEPVRGQMLCYKTEPGWLKPIIMDEEHYLIPRKDGRVLAGSTVERTGFDTSVTEEARRTIHAAATRLVPGLESAEIEAHWSGLRPGNANGLPTVAIHPGIKGLYVNAGHFRNGLVMAPASARLMADLILERSPIVDPAPFAFPAQ